MMYAMMAMDIPSNAIKCEKLTDDGQICGGKLNYKYSDEDYDHYRCFKCGKWTSRTRMEGL